MSVYGKSQDTIGSIRIGVLAGGGGGRLSSNYARMCVSKSEGHGSFFGFKGVKMGVKFAASLIMGENFC